MPSHYTHGPDYLDKDKKKKKKKKQIPSHVGLAAKLKARKEATERAMKGM